MDRSHCSAKKTLKVATQGPHIAFLELEKPGHELAITSASAPNIRSERDSI